MNSLPAFTPRLIYMQNHSQMFLTPIVKINKMSSVFCGFYLASLLLSDNYNLLHKYTYTRRHIQAKPM